MSDTPEHQDRGVQLKLLSRKMVHSLNNMLFIIDAYKDMIKKDQTDPELLENLQQIETAIDQTQRIMREWRTDADKIVPDPTDD